MLNSLLIVLTSSNWLPDGFQRGSMELSLMDPLEGTRSTTQEGAKHKQRDMGCYKQVADANFSWCPSHIVSSTWAQLFKLRCNFFCVNNLIQDPAHEIKIKQLFTLRNGVMLPFYVARARSFV